MKNIPEINNRIRWVIENKDKSQTSAALRLKMTRSYLSRISSPGGPLGVPFLVNFVTAYPDLNARWLLTGVGEPFPVDNTVKEPQAVYGVLVDQIKLLQKLLEERNKG